MGNYKFKLSHMIPNTWFYKLKDISNTTTTTANHHNKPPSCSYHSCSTTTAPPQKHHFCHSTSSKRSTPNRKTIYKPSPKHTESTHSPSSESTQFSPKVQLPLIITKPRNRQTLGSSKKGKESDQPPARKLVSGVKLRKNSPKLAVSKRIVQKSAKSENLLESFAVVKSSFDPEKDFMQSMMEMISENKIRSSKDLEELLACYLSLNSDEYHDVIVKAFEKIWFSLGSLKT